MKEYGCLKGFYKKIGPKHRFTNYSKAVLDIKMQRTFSNLPDKQDVYNELQIQPEKHIVTDFVNPSFETSTFNREHGKTKFAMQPRPDLFPVKEEHERPAIQHQDNEFNANMHATTRLSTTCLRDF